jgi:hypothetical protein
LKKSKTRSLKVKHCSDKAGSGGSSPSGSTKSIHTIYRWVSGSVVQWLERPAVNRLMGVQFSPEPLKKTPFSFIEKGAVVSTVNISDCLSEAGGSIPPGPVILNNECLGYRGEIGSRAWLLTRSPWGWRFKSFRYRIANTEKYPLLWGNG